MKGSFRDLGSDNNSEDLHNRSNGRNAGLASRSNVARGDPNAGLNNYSTFFSADPSVQSLLRTSDKIEQSKKTMHESEDAAKHIMVDLELQRGQLNDMKGMVTETSSMTSQVRSLLQIIADRSYRRKVCLWGIIILLAATDIVVFYLLFVR